MSIYQVKQLHNGDQVFWRANSGHESDYFTIMKIEWLDESTGAIRIYDLYGKVKEVFCHELA